MHFEEQYKSHVVRRLQELGIELVAPPIPGGAYQSVIIRGSIAYVSIQFPILGEQFLYQGRLGNELGLDEGIKAARLAATNILLQIHQYIGFDSILGLNQLEVYYQAAANWDEAPKMADGASLLLKDVLGEKGMHSRLLAGVERLPRNFSVGLVCSITLL